MIITAMAASVAVVVQSIGDGGRCRLKTVAPMRQQQQQLGCITVTFSLPLRSPFLAVHRIEPNFAALMAVVRMAILPSFCPECRCVPPRYAGSMEHSNHRCNGSAVFSSTQLNS